MEEVVDPPRCVAGGALGTPECARKGPVTAVWAHRGARDLARENTLDAFREARRLGADGVELDVRGTLDGGLAVHHDAALDDGRVIAQLRSAELPPWLPTLEAALEECRGLTVNVEVKSLPTDVGYDPEEGAAAGTAALVAGMGLAGSVVISSFSMAAIDAARAAAPEVPTGWLTLRGYDQLDALARAGARGHTSLHPHYREVTAGLVRTAHERGMAVYTWTVDGPDDVRLVAGAGVDAVITNVPAVALAALGR